MKHVMKVGCLFVLALLIGNAVMAQKKQSADSAATAQALSDRRFVFTPQTMLPMTGRTRQVTPDYSVKVSGDSLISYLPYVGRAYTAPIGSSRGPLDFTLAGVSYDNQPRKKGGWTIILKPAQSGDIQQYVFTVFSNGSASLQVSSTNRQPISYNGYLKPLKK